MADTHTFSISWDNEGSFSVRAKVVDNYNVTTLSSIIQISVVYPIHYSLSLTNDITEADKTMPITLSLTQEI